jgi:ribosome biogenesis GTPase / thiamine phosphate phosphatase
LGAPAHRDVSLSSHGRDELTARRTAGATAVLLGSSGVGKSTLVNRFAGEELMATTETRADDDEGHHTTSHRELILLPGGGIVIDTPGLRELQLWNAADGVEEAFADIEELAGVCRFSDCTHTLEPGCAVLAAVASGTLATGRLESWRKLHRELQALDVRQDALLRQEETRKWRNLARALRAKAKHR